MADMFSDDTIVPAEVDENPVVWSTSKHFHKTFVKAGGYSLEFDINADPHYDSNGLGRIHKKDAPSSLCLSVPFTKHPDYGLNGMENKCGFSICPAVKKENGEWIFASEEDVSYQLAESKTGEKDCLVAFDCTFANGKKARFACSVDENGVTLQAQAEEETGICLPIFSFDGEAYTKITEKEGKIFVEYDGWTCEYETDCLQNLHEDFANRNGIYKGYIASGAQRSQVKIKIYKSEK
jgi:hypothetical protein